MSEKLVIIEDNIGVAALIEYLADKDYVAFDTETTGVKKDSEIIGYSLCAEPGVGYYVITAAWNSIDNSLNYKETKSTAVDVMKALSKKQLVMHNGVFDCSMVWNNYKVQLIDALHTDTMVLAHLLDENRRVGLKELGASFYGASAKKEQEEMKASVSANGGTLTKDKYEMYKADPQLMAKYGAKDAILTYNLFYELVPELFEEKLDKFFYEDESMPLLRGPTYDLNTTGLKIDLVQLETLKKQLEIETLELKEFIYSEIRVHINEVYPGTSKKTQFNIGSGSQLAWLLFHKLGNSYIKLGTAGKELAEALNMRNPYSKADKEEFTKAVINNKDFIYREAGTVFDPKTRKYKGAGKVRDYWAYLSTDKAVLAQFSKKYKWVEKLLEYKKLTKLLTTYVQGIQNAVQYGVIHPSFLQHGTTSGRYSCKQPNFQNLPRDDKRIKSCIISRPGKVFVGADYSQLEPRVFAFMSGDERLKKCFSDGDDFYSIIGAEVFDKVGLSMKKDNKDSFANKHKDLRNIAKVVALSATYGTTAYKMAGAIGKTVEEAQDVIDKYFIKFPAVYQFMLNCHQQAKTTGYVVNHYGRPRRMPEAKKIDSLYGKKAQHGDLPYEVRNILNLAVNHTVQSTGASIMNRAAIACHKYIQLFVTTEPIWKEVKIVLQVHDEMILEGPKELEDEMALVLKTAMEQAVTLEGVTLVAEPRIGNNLAALK